MRVSPFEFSAAPAHARRKFNRGVGKQSSRDASGRVGREIAFYLVEETENNSGLRVNHRREACGD